MNWLSLFKLLILSHLKREKMSVLITIISVTLGITIYVAIRLTTINILLGFDASTNYLGNQDTVIISSKDPIPESFIYQLVNLPDVNAIIPYSSRYVPAYIGNQNKGYLQLVGIDTLSIKASKLNNVEAYWALLQANPVLGLLPPQLVNSNQLMPIRLLINGEFKSIMPLSVFDASMFGGQEIILIDIKNFQDLFNEYGFVDQLYLTFNTTNIQQALTEVAKILPSSLQLSQGNDNAQYAEKIAFIYRFNLNLLICIALLVTGMIVYNAISHYILDRRRDFGIMLMLGTEPWHLLLLTLLTTVLMAVICSLGGLALGYLIVLFKIKFVIQTFSTLLLPFKVSTVVFPAALVVEVLGIISGIVLLVSIFPCLDIYKIPVRQTTSYQTYESQFKTHITAFNLLGFSLLVLSSCGMLPVLIQWCPALASYSLCGLVLGILFFLPFLLRLFLRYLRRFSSRGWLEATMAIDHINMTLRKNVTAIAAMSVAIVLYFSAIILIDSNRYTTISWANQILSADIYINNKYSSFTFMGKYIPKQVTDYISSSEKVSAANFLIHKDIDYKNQPLRVIGMDFSTVGTYYKIPFIYQQNTASLGEQGVFVSEHFAHEFNCHVGDTIHLKSNHGVVQIKILNIFYNYSSFQNIVLISDALFKALYDDPRTELALIYLKNPNQSQSFLNDLYSNFPKENLSIQNQIEVKQTGIGMLDQTFKISKIIISAVFLLTTLTLFNILEQLILNRKHEFTMFWSLGASDKQLAKMCLWESLIIYMAAILSSIVPTVICLTLVFNYLTTRLFGIELLLSISWESIFIFLLTLTLLIILGGFIPALKTKKFINAAELRNE